jgi:hypothetical protein
MRFSFPRPRINRTKIVMTLACTAFALAGIVPSGGFSLTFLTVTVLFCGQQLYRRSLWTPAIAVYERGFTFTRRRELRFVDWRYLGHIDSNDEAFRIGPLGLIRIVTHRRRYVIAEGGLRFELTGPAAQAAEASLLRASTTPAALRART